MHQKIKLTLCMVFALLTAFSYTARANDGDSLKLLLDQIDSFSAAFTQHVYDESNTLVHEASGELLIKRPNKLRWEALVPDETVLIADGEAIWHIDYFVEQVTAMTQASAIENNPMVLLTSNDESLWQTYKIERILEKSFKVTPKVAAGQVRSLTLHFDDDGLTGLVMLDSQGQQSQFSFAKRMFNPPIDDAQFTLNVPDGFMVDDQR